MIKPKTSREMLLKNVDEASFAVNEATLYLDTHPNDKSAMRYFERRLNDRIKAIQAYEQSYGPLLVDNIDASGDSWSWTDAPMPWEEGGN